MRGVHVTGHVRPEPSKGGACAHVTGHVRLWRLAKKGSRRHSVYLPRRRGVGDSREATPTRNGMGRNTRTCATEARGSEHKQRTRCRNMNDGWHAGADAGVLTRGTWSRLESVPASTGRRGCGRSRDPNTPRGRQVPPEAQAETHRHTCSKTGQCQGAARLRDQAARTAKARVRAGTAAWSSCSNLRASLSCSSRTCSRQTTGGTASRRQMCTSVRGRCGKGCWLCACRTGEDGAYGSVSSTPAGFCG